MFTARPEVVTGAPNRIEPGMPVPLVCMIKNAGNQTIILESINVKIKKNRRTIREITALKNPIDVRSSRWHKAFLVPLPDDLSGSFEIDTTIRLRRNNKVYTFRNDSYRGGGHKTVKAYRARDPLPGLSNFCYGNLHCHQYTKINSDFSGISIPVYAEIAKAMGLQFFTAADYLYESSVLNSNTGQDDSEMGKCERFQKAVDAWNKKNEIIILRGEEVICRNRSGGDVNLLIINYPEFIHRSTSPEAGNSDSKLDSSLNELLSRIDSETLTFAVHPGKKPSFIALLLFRKGEWGTFDLTLSGLTGLQICSGHNGFFLDQGLLRWIKLLLMGERKFVIAGSEEHCNFNRNGRKRFPFLSGRDTADLGQVFGEVRTGIFCTPPIIPEKIVESIKNGRLVITNGPLMDFTVRNEIGERSLLGGELNGSMLAVKYRAVSTPEYGPIRRLRFYSGNISARVEEPIYTIDFRDRKYSVQNEINLEPRGAYGYIRGELFSGDNEQKLFCYTNPVWIRSSKS